MSWIQTLAQRVRNSSQHARVALVAECGERVRPVYEEYWVGTYSASVGRSVELGWTFACGGKIDAAETQACIAEVRDVVEFYNEEGISILAAVVTVALRVLESMSSDEDASCMAVARGLNSDLNAAQLAEAMANQATPKAARQEVAMAQEEAWQNRALDLIAGWKGVAKRDMFASLNDKPPPWLIDWKARSRR